MEPANLHRILDADVVSTAQSLCADLDAAAILEAFKSVKHKRLENVVEQAAFRTSLRTQRKAATPDIDTFVRRSLQRGPSSGVSAMSDGSQEAVRRASEDSCLDGVLNAASDVVANGSHFRDGPPDSPCRLEEVLEDCSDDDEGPAGRRQVGIMEMRPLAERSGGYIVMSESFTGNIFKQSFKAVFERDATGQHLRMAFGGTLEVPPDE